MEADQSNSPAAVPFGKSEASVALDAVRGAAALLVLADHWRHSFFVELHAVAAHRLLFVVPYMVAVTGHQAVIIFFMLSGFLVGGSVMRAVERNSWSWRQYLLHRLVRLWIVLLPALMLGAFWDRMTLLRTLRDPGGVSVFLHTVVVPGIRGSLNVPDFLANALFLQTLRVPGTQTVLPTFGSNAALWSLSNEFWYYVLFPCALFVVARTYKTGWRVIFLGLFVILSVIVGGEIMVLFPVWLGGLLLLYLPKPGLGIWVRVGASVLYAPVFVACAALSRKVQYSDAVLAVFTAMFLWALLCGSRSPAKPGIAQTAARGMARFSYTLYLVHMPLLYFLGSMLAIGEGWQPTARHVLTAAGVGVVILLYAWCVASLTEFHNDAARRWVEARFPLLTGRNVPLVVPRSA